MPSSIITGRHGNNTEYRDLPFVTGVISGIMDASTIIRNKEQIMKPISVFALFVLLISGVSAQNFDEVTIKTTRLTDSIYMLEGMGGNIGVSTGEDGTFIIDNQFAPLTDKINAAIAAITDRPVDMVINTHWHYDHSDGNENFGRAGALILAHENSRKRMTMEQSLPLFNHVQKAYGVDGLPRITFNNAISLHLNGETVNIFHRGNAHTDGDAVVHFTASNIIHTGDVFVRYGFPFIDEPHGGHIDGMIETVEYVAGLADESTRIIPGHGALAVKSDLYDFTGMLKTIRDRVQQGINAGKTLDEIIESKPTAGFEERGIETGSFIRIVYGNLTK